MRYPTVTQQFVEKELYKLCAGPVIQQTLGYYSDRSTWQPQDIIKRLIQACLEQTSLEDICSSSDGPSADRVHTRLAAHQLDQIERLVNAWLTDVASRQQFHPQTKLTVAFDFHQHPYYGDPSPEWITTMERKRGTNYAVTFLLVSIATGTKRCPVAVRLMTKALMKRKAHLIDQILSDLCLWLPIKRVLLDRGFCELAIMQRLEARGLAFIIAAIRHGAMKTAAQEIQAWVTAHARQARVDATDPIQLGQWARKQGLDSIQVKGLVLDKQPIPGVLVAVLVRQRTPHRDPLKRYTVRLFYLAPKTFFFRFLSLGHWLFLHRIDCSR